MDWLRNRRDWLDPNYIGRRLLKRVGASVVMRKALPAEFGAAQIYVTPAAELKHLKPGTAGLDKLLFGWAREFTHPGTTVWDIGGNVGVFGFAAAGRGASVLIVEPDPFLAYLLTRSMQRNKNLRVRVVSAAIAAKVGLAAFKISAGGRAANALAQFAGDRSGFDHELVEVMVPTITLDSLLAASATPHFVKLDIEGGEVAAMEGASAVLQYARPVWVVETSPQTRERVASIFKRYRYQLHDAASSSREQIEIPTFNTLAIPG